MEREEGRERIGPETGGRGPAAGGLGNQAVLRRVEQRSGWSLEDVQVHERSDKPARIGALAYTQGNQVYLGPGQERLLGHELGHVVQQKEGRVRATKTVGGMPLNDDPELEREADRFL